MKPIDGRTPIAETRVIWALPSGERASGRIAICAPEPFKSNEVDNETTWACWCVLEGLSHRPYPILGEGSMQPLLLALQTIGHELHAFISCGGRVLDPDSEDDYASTLISLRFFIQPPGAQPAPDPVLADVDAWIAKPDEDDT